MLMFNIIVSMIATSSLLLLVSNMSNVKINYTGRLQVNSAYEALQFDLRNTILNEEVLKKIKDDTKDSLSTKAAIGTCNQSLRCITNDAIDCRTLFNTNNEQPLECIYKKGTADNSSEMIFDSRNPNEGFDLEGNKCNEFSKTTPSSFCVFRPKFTFKVKDCPVAAGDPCIGFNKDIDVYVMIEYASKSPYTINATARRLRAVIDN